MLAACCRQPHPFCSKIGQCGQCVQICIASSLAHSVLAYVVPCPIIFPRAFAHETTPPLNHLLACKEWHALGTKCSLMDTVGTQKCPDSLSDWEVNRGWIACVLALLPHSFFSRVQTISWKPRAQVYHNFLSDREARHILNLSRYQVCVRVCVCGACVSWSAVNHVLTACTSACACSCSLCPLSNELHHREYRRCSSMHRCKEF